MVLYRGAETPVGMALGLATLNPLHSAAAPASRCALPLSPMAQLLLGAWDPIVFLAVFAGIFGLAHVGSRLIPRMRLRLPEGLVARSLTSIYLLSCPLACC